MSGHTSDMVENLRSLLGDGVVVDDQEVMSGYEVDWTGRFRGRAGAVVRPHSVEDVQAVVRWCMDTQTPLVTQGGNTGLVGGSVPDDSATAVVLSLRGLARIDDLDLGSGQVTVGAGVTLARLDAALQSTPWEFGVDLGARESATLGGMAATNAGGLRVLRYGTMRANVLGVEAVLGTGERISHLHGLVKDNTGYDLAGLLCGSEGTLGVMTSLRLRLVPRWPDRCAVWIGCRDWAHAMTLASRARLEIDGLDGLEAVDARGLHLVQDRLGLAELFRRVPPVALLIAWAGRGQPPETLGDLVAGHDHVVGADPRAWRSLWAYRERVTEAVAHLGVPRKFDVTLPAPQLAEFTEAVHALEGAREAVVFGHLGDGNLHVNLPGLAAPCYDGIDEEVLTLVAEFGGSISAEHGIGRHKAAWLGLNRSPAELATFAALKAALDPHGIMNPGVLLTG